MNQKPIYQFTLNKYFENFKRNTFIMKSIAYEEEIKGKIIILFIKRKTLIYTVNSDYLLTS